MSPTSRPTSTFTAFPYAVPIENAIDIADPEVDVPAEALASLEAHQLRVRLAALPPLERKTVEWSFGIDCEPMTLREIARRLNRSVGGVHLLRERAVGHLRDAYRDDLAA